MKMKRKIKSYEEIVEIEDYNAEYTAKTGLEPPMSVNEVILYLIFVTEKNIKKVLEK